MTRMGDWLRRLRGVEAADERPDGRAKLRSGAHGVSAEFPEAWPVESDFDNDGFALSDPDHRVTWGVFHSPVPLILRRDQEQILEHDIRDAARVAFDAESRQSRAERPDGATLSKRFEFTKDPAWSPVVDSRRIALNGGGAAMIIHRLAHEYGKELVCGRLLIPTAYGVTEVECRAKDTTSGVRQALLVVMSAEAQELSKTAPRLALHAFYDEARHDSLVPDALSRVRAALAWLTGVNGVNLRVTAPPRPADGDVVVLEAAGCSIRLPPRYVRVPSPESLPRSLVTFARVTLSVVVSSPWLMGVFRMDHAAGVSDTDGLRNFARESTQSWTKGGGVEIDAIESQPVPPRPGHLETRTMVLFRVDGRPLRAIQHWIKPTEANIDEAVWRLSVNVDAEVDIVRFESEMDALAASWQRMGSAT